MPEAAVDEDRDHRAGENDVGPAPQPRYWREVDAVAQPGRMQEPADREFRPRVAWTLALHLPPDSVRGRPGAAVPGHVRHIDDSGGARQTRARAASRKSDGQIRNKVVEVEQAALSDDLVECCDLQRTADRRYGGRQLR